MPGSILGNSVVRVEDPDLLTGRGTFVDNLPLPGALHLAFVRSPVAHAMISNVELDEARRMPGVVAVYTNADIGIPPQPALISLNDLCVRPPLADGRVRFAGEPVAVVVADSKAAAVDAVEAVVVDYEPLGVVVDTEAALQDGAPVQFEAVGSNLVAGFRDPGDDGLAGADIVVRGRFENQRVAAVPMEGDAIAVSGADDAGHELVIHVSTQSAHGFGRIMQGVFGIEPGRLRLVAPHVGGAFGAKAGPRSEHIVAIAVARKLGRPVKWIETRSENLLGMPHGRSQVHYVEMGLRRDGTIVGMHCRVLGDAGAYGGFGGSLAMGPTRTMAQGVYRIPAIAYDVAVAVTNTTPVGAFRGAGRPEAAAFLERIVDMAADELGIDPAEIRRRNFLQPAEFPLRTLMGAEYDSGDYEAALDAALAAADYPALRAEQAGRRARRDIVQLGIGLSTYVEITAGSQPSEFASVEVHHDGGATIRVGTSAHGQGHATAFAMIVSDRLGIPIERIRFIQSDTALVPRGSGTAASRSLQIGGTAVHEAAIRVLDLARKAAANLLEASPDDIVVTQDGRVGVAGVPTSALSWAELAVAAQGEGEPLEASLDVEQAGPTFPFGAHVAVVEVDTETGRVTPLRHVAVDDCGRIINPLLVTGQQHGGIAQGMAQALWEQFVYDEDGNPLTSTLAEYAMPSAAEVPSLEASNTQTPTPLNPLGAKGIGESGTIGALPAVHNAVIDALLPFGVRHIDMPCTPQRVWQAIADARAGRPEPGWRAVPDIFATLPERPPGGRRAVDEIDI